MKFRRSKWANGIQAVQIGIPTVQNGQNRTQAVQIRIPAVQNGQIGIQAVQIALGDSDTENGE